MYEENWCLIFILRCYCIKLVTHVYTHIIYTFIKRFGKKWKLEHNHRIIKYDLYIYIYIFSTYREIQSDTESMYTYIYLHYQFNVFLNVPYYFTNNLGRIWIFWHKKFLVNIHICISFYNSMIISLIWSTVITCLNGFLNMNFQITFWQLNY